MMDRHLIFPPNHSNANRSSTWDGDPALKGKPIPVFGTHIILNTEDDIDAWIAERRKKWPTLKRKQEKIERKREAVGRGEIHMEDLGRKSKRPRIDSTSPSDNVRPRRPKRTNLEGAITESASIAPTPEVLEELKAEFNVDPNSSDDQGPEELPSKTTPPMLAPYHERDSSVPERCTALLRTQVQSGNKGAFQRSIRGKLNSHAYGTKHCLLRSLLLPEIGHSVSNLSQAIRFVVENQFFDDVELNAGEGQERLVQTIHPSPNIETKEVSPCTLTL